jgi:paired mesoderm homeobox protein 2
LQVWFQNRRAKFRKQERLAQQKVTNNNDTSVKNESSKQQSAAGNTTPKDIKPGSPLSTGLSTTPNSSASSHHSNNGDIKPINGKRNLYAFLFGFSVVSH